jgi:hypothetical protein
MITDERKRRGQWSLSDEASRLNDLQSFLSARFQVQNLIFNTPRPANLGEDERWADLQLKALLLSELRLTCTLHQCECLGKDRAPVEILVCEEQFHSGSNEPCEISGCRTDQVSWSTPRRLLLKKCRVLPYMFADINHSS